MFTLDGGGQSYLTRLDDGPFGEQRAEHGEWWSSEVLTMEGVLGAWGRPRSHCVWPVLEEVPEANSMPPMVFRVLLAVGISGFQLSGQVVSRADTSGSGRGQRESLSWEGCGDHRWRWAEGPLTKFSMFAPLYLAFPVTMYPL